MKLRSEKFAVISEIRVKSSTGKVKNFGWVSSAPDAPGAAVHPEVVGSWERGL
jgi:hypothetical protein